MWNSLRCSRRGVIQQSCTPQFLETSEKTTFRAKHFLNSCITASQAGYYSQGVLCDTGTAITEQRLHSLCPRRQQRLINKSLLDCKPFHPVGVPVLQEKHKWNTQLKLSTAVGGHGQPALKAHRETKQSGAGRTGKFTVTVYTWTAFCDSGELRLETTKAQGRLACWSATSRPGVSLEAYTSHFFLYLPGQGYESPSESSFPFRIDNTRPVSLHSDLSVTLWVTTRQEQVCWIT